MLCTGEAGAFNPVLLDCLREIENEIDDAMRRRPEPRQELFSYYSTNLVKSQFILVTCR